MLLVGTGPGLENTNPTKICEDRYETRIGLGVIGLRTQRCVGGQELVLNGYGLRIKYVVVKAYVGALYTPKKIADGDLVVNANVPRRMSMTMLRKIQLDDLYKSLIEGMTNNSTPAEMTALAPKIKQIKDGFDALPVLEKGDTITIDFLPVKGMIITVRGKPFETIKGDDISRAVLRIWFGKKPIQDDLKEKLLGLATS
jgi:hypothetical protein